MLPFEPSIAPALTLLHAAGAGLHWGVWDCGAVCVLGAVPLTAALTAALAAMHWGSPRAAALLMPVAGAALVLCVMEVPNSRGGAVVPWATGPAALLVMIPVGALLPAAAAGVLAPFMLAKDMLLHAGVARRTRQPRSLQNQAMHVAVGTLFVTNPDEVTLLLQHHQAPPRHSQGSTHQAHMSTGMPEPLVARMKTQWIEPKMKPVSHNTFLCVPKLHN